MNEKTLKELLAERSTLTEKLVEVSNCEDHDRIDEVCRALASNFLESLELALNPVAEPAHFLAIFALNAITKVLADTVPGSREMAEEYAKMVDIKSTMVSFPHFKREDEEEEDDEE